MQRIARCPIGDSGSCKPVYVGRTTRKPLDPARWGVSRCPDCDHGFLNPRPSWEELANYYHSGYGAYESSYGMSASLEATIANAKAYGMYRHVGIYPGQAILDVGAGGGSFLRVAMSLGADAVGVEPSKFGAQSARDLGLDVFEGTLEQYVSAGATKRFDLITFSHVVEHLPDPIATIALAAGLLKPRGRVWIAVPNGACRAARRLGWRWHSTDLPLHLHHFCPESIRVLAERSGVVLQKVSTFSLPKAVFQSTLLELRHRWFVPKRIGSLVLSQRIVEQRAAEMDAEDRGEAILAEFGRREDAIA